MNSTKTIWSRWLPVVSVLLFVASDVASSADAEKRFHRFWPDNLYAVSFVDERTGYIAGYSGTLLSTIDGGKHWDAHYIGRNELIRRLAFVDAQQGWAVGHRGTIFHTSNAGKTWEVQATVPNAYLRDVSFADLNNGWVVGHESTILHTADGGKSWNEQKLDGYKGRDVPRLHGVYAKDANTAMLVGEFGVIAHTEDGGAHWSLVEHEARGTLLAVTASGERYLAVGLDGAIQSISPVAAVESRVVRNGRLAPKPAATPKTYQVQAIDSGTKEHFFAVAAANGHAVAAGHSVVIKIADNKAVPLRAEESLALPFAWFGGASVLPSGRFWLVGIRGTVASGDAGAGSFGLAFNLAATDQVKLVSSRWTGDAQ